jgi:hypothetical protein
MTKAEVGLSLPDHQVVLRAQQVAKTWCVALAISVGTYLYLIVQFPTGNHDWERMSGLEFYSYQMQLGRWMSPAVYALTGFRQLPVLSALIALTAYVSAGFATCFLIESTTRKEVPRAAYLVAGLLCALIPFSNWTFYYSWMAAMAPLSQLTCVVGLTYVVRTGTLRSAAIGALAMCASLATYQSSINTAALLFWLVAILLIAVRVRDDDRTAAFRRVLVLAGSITLGAGLYKLSLSILKAFDLLADTYHFRFISWQELPGRIVEVAGASVGHLAMPHPFFPQSIKLLLLGLSLAGLLQLVVLALRSAPASAEAAEGESATTSATPRFAGAVLVVLGFGLMVFCSKIQFLVTEKTTYYDNRFASFGPTYVYLSFIVLALTYLSPRLRFAQLAMSALCVWSCIVADLSWQDAHVKQNEFDKRLVDRIIARIESLPEFRYDKSYDLVQLGNIPNIRGEYYDYAGEASPYHTFTIMPGWSPQDAYVGLEPRLDIRRSVKLERALRRASDPRASRLVEHIQASRPWPHPSAVGIVDDYLVILLSKQGFRSAERKLQER